MLRRFFDRHRTRGEFLPYNEFYGPINAFADSRLARLGFVRSKKGTWVVEDCLSGRPMIQLWHYKGAVSAPVWGYALTYVPHFTSSFRKLAWHRTVKSARLDVFPFDELQRVPDLNRLATSREHETAVEQVFDAAIVHAARFFERFRSTDDLLLLFERLRRDRGDGLGYWNYTNMPVAHAFTLRVTGNEGEGRSILDKYVQRMKISGKALDDLLRRFEQAAADPALL